MCEKGNSGEWKGDSMRMTRGGRQTKKNHYRTEKCGKRRCFSKLGLQRRQKNGISFLLPHDMFSSLKCVLLPTSQAIRYGAYNTKDDISKDVVQGGPPGAVSLVRNRLILQEQLFSLPLLCLLFADDFISFVLQ